MNQLLQDNRTGRLAVRDIPAPAVGAGEVLIANRASLVSAGTERMAVDLARQSLLGKARERPDQVRRVVEKVRQEGLAETVRQVRQKLDEPLAMGYSSAGVVLAVGAGVNDLKPGDRVASNGPHAEVVAVPRNLARMPAGVSFEAASFGVLGSIALHGVRLAECQLGETVLVIGLGLVGQLTVAVLKASGVRVFGIDLDPARCELARQMGAEAARCDLGPADIAAATAGLGADAVIITASTSSNGPIETAAAAVRQKGRIVLVGVVGLKLDRRPFYFKECEFVVSCSYGPGRYDANYEQRGRDYPAAYVRWTEQRNIQAVLDLIGRGRLDVGPLITHRFAIEEAERAYQLLDADDENYLAIVLAYPASDKATTEQATEEATATETVAVQPAGRPPERSSPTAAVGVSDQSKTVRLRDACSADCPAGPVRLRCGILGAGNFARQVLLPAIRANGAFDIVAVCSAKGVSAEHVGRQFDAQVATTDEAVVFDDEKIDCVFSITRHHLHARHAVQAMEAGKHLFVEKPLCMNETELDEIEQARTAAGENARVAMVGFNRRFSPAARKVRAAFADVNTPLTVSIRFNAGAVPADHWTRDPEEGGGRIIGEACHGIDLATYLCGSPAVRVYAESGGGAAGNDEALITLRHANGSISSIAYVASGDRALAKERVEVFGGGQVGVIDDFRSVTIYRDGRKKTSNGKQQKGHAEEIAAFVAAVRGEAPPPIPWQELLATTRAAIKAVKSMQTGVPEAW